MLDDECPFILKMKDKIKKTWEIVKEFLIAFFMGFDHYCQMKEEIYNEEKRNKQHKKSNGHAA